MIPNDPFILLSYVNTQLRDFYPTLEEMCKSLSLKEEELIKIRKHRLLLRCRLKSVCLKEKVIKEKSGVSRRISFISLEQSAKSVFSDFFIKVLYFSLYIMYNILYML